MIGNVVLDKLKERNDEVAARIRALIDAHAPGDITVGSTTTASGAQHRSIVLSAYFIKEKEADCNLNLSIDFGEEKGITEADFSIFRDEGGYILSPRVFTLDGDLPGDFEQLLEEYYNVFELLVKNYIWNRADFVSAYLNQW